MVSWTPKQRAVLKANPDWKGTKPAFPDVILVDIEDTKAAELGFEAHEVQVAHIGLETAARYKKSPPADAKLINLPGPLYTWMGMNTQNPKLNDIRVRQAIQRAIDVEFHPGGRLCRLGADGPWRGSPGHPRPSRRLQISPTSRTKRRTC